MRTPAIALLALLAACATEPSSQSIASHAPALGKADGGDRADRACQVVLRGAGRLPGGEEPELDCSSGECLYVWRGTVELAESLPAEASAHVLYHRVSDSTWWQVDAVWQADAPGFRRFAFAMSEHLWGPGGGEAIELVAFARLPGGERLFDHNRHVQDFENHWLTAEGSFFTHDGGVCQPMVGTLSFLEDWQELASGTLRQGGYLTLEYDLDRLPHCRGTHNGYPAWDIVAFARFAPGGQLLSGSVRGVVDDLGQPVSQGVERPLSLRIPADADAVEIWFLNTTGAGSSCQAWDSNDSQNYRFAIWPAADHPRCQDVERDNGGHYESDLMMINAPHCVGYDLAAQLDADRCEFELEGLGAGSMGHYGIPYGWLVAYLRVHAVEGQVLHAGVFSRFHDAQTGAQGQRFSLGLEQEPGLWRAGVATRVTGMGGMLPVDRAIDEFAFFLDVRRPSGEVVRLWHSRHGANYRWDDAFSLPATTEYIPYGNVQWANAEAAVYDSRRACR